MISHFKKSLGGDHVYFNRLTLPVLITFVVMLTVAFVHARSWITADRKTTVLPTEIQASITSNPTSSQNSSVSHIDVVRITAVPTGFEPNEIERPTGPFLLAFDNQSGLEDVTMQLRRVEGNNHTNLRELKVSLKQLRKREVITLPPGRYEMTEANHSNWVCHITINEH